MAKRKRAEVADAAPVSAAGAVLPDTGHNGHVAAAADKSSNGVVDLGVREALEIGDLALRHLNGEQVGDPVARFDSTSNCARRALMA